MDFNFKNWFRFIYLHMSTETIFNISSDFYELNNTALKKKNTIFYVYRLEI